MLLLCGEKPAPIDHGFLFDALPGVYPTYGRIPDHCGSAELRGVRTRLFHHDVREAGTALVPNFLPRRRTLGSLSRPSRRRSNATSSHAGGVQHDDLLVAVTIGGSIDYWGDTKHNKAPLERGQKSRLTSRADALHAVPGTTPVRARSVAEIAPPRSRSYSFASSASFGSAHRTFLRIMNVATSPGARYAPSDFKRYDAIAVISRASCPSPGPLRS